MNVLIMVGLVLIIGMGCALACILKEEKPLWPVCFVILGLAVILLCLGTRGVESGYPSLEPISTGNHQIISASQEAGRWYLVVKMVKGKPTVRLFVLPQAVVEERTGDSKKLVVIREGGLSKVTLFLPEGPKD